MHLCYSSLLMQLPSSAVQYMLIPSSSFEFKISGKKRWVSSPQYCCYFKLSSFAFSTIVLTLQWSLYSRVKYLHFGRWKEIKIAIAETWVRAHNPVIRGTRSMEKHCQITGFRMGSALSEGKCHRNTQNERCHWHRARNSGVERSKHNLRGVLAEPDGQWTRAMEQQGLCFQWLSWACWGAIFENALAFASLHPLQVISQLSLQHGIS